MMNFDLSNEKIGSAVSESGVLEPNKIHSVKFKGIEYALSKNEAYCFMRCKFAGEGGFFSDLSFGPDKTKPESDWNQDSQTSWGSVNPSREKSFNLKVKHILNAVAPEFLEKLQNGEIAFKPKGGDLNSQFKQLVDFISENTKYAIDKETQIKLIANNKGEGAFPSFFAGMGKDNRPFLKTNFVGNNLSFSSFELDKINKASSAKPTTMPAGLNMDLGSEPSADESKPASDLLNMSF